ncbi:hypothetical protein ACHAW5_003878 [Stephanodiscus triporus]|uniref:Alcohol dehydrogenase n=1 Tax=Stephanodiscus triporus TaxID=2934178 RepID=A0ABD3N1H5_9STRA
MSTQLGFVVSGDKAELRRVPVPVPAEDECVVRVLIANICNTDLEIMKGYMGFAGVVGHEFVGIVEAAPVGHEALVGRRVVGDINLACGDVGRCQTCACGADRARNHCPARTVLGILNKDGTYQERITLPARNLHVVPDNVSSENAAFVEPLAAAFRIVEQGLVSPTDRVAIVGDGKLGILIAEVLGRAQAAAGGPRVVVVGRHPEKMALISSAAAVDAVASHGALPSRAAAFDVVVDATGSPAGLDLSRSLCRPLGTLVLKSTCAAGSDFNTAPFVVDEIRMVGSRCGPFPPALDLLASGLDLTPLITATFPLVEANAAVAMAAARGTVKVQIRVHDDPVPSSLS